MNLRKATHEEKNRIWEILRHAIEQRRLDGSRQWQDGYPNEQSVQSDLDHGYAYVLDMDHRVVAYTALIFDGEPAYESIEGQWLSNGPYAVLHRVAVAPGFKGRGLAAQLFERVAALCLEKGVYSIKVDTNFDNAPMLRILDKLGYTYCGEVYFRGSARRAYEKLLLR